MARRGELANGVGEVRSGTPSHADQIEGIIGGRYVEILYDSVRWYMYARSLSGLVFSGQGAFRPHASPLYVSVVDIRNGVIGFFSKVKVGLVASSLYISDLNSFDYGVENVSILYQTVIFEILVFSSIET